MAVRVFLDGLNQLGVSMAYALPKEVFEITVFDQETSLARKVKKEKHASKVVTMVADGAKSADIIIIDQPVDLLSMHYDAIGESIRPGAVLIDTSPVPLFAGRLAEKFISPEVGFVSLVAGLNVAYLSKQPFHHTSAGEDIFKNSMTTKGAFQSKDKMQILFNPAPTDPNVNNIAKRLSVDLSKLDNKRKKEVYDNIEKDFEEGLKEIYDLTLQTKKWVGSDIWRFFKAVIRGKFLD